MTTSTTRVHDGQNVMNFLFSLLFLIIIALSLWGLYLRTGTIPHSIPLFDVILITLASFRITRLVVYDKITRFFREWFMHRRVYEKDGQKWIEVTPYVKGIRGTLYELVICPWCIGMWSALIATFCYFAFPWTWYVLLLLAIAGVSSLLQLTANAIGWKAENLKLDAKIKEDRTR